MAKTRDTADAEMAALDGISPATHPAGDATHFRRIIAARKAVERADDGLRRAVAEARAAGDSRTVIGAALGTTRQNAYQRFGRDSKPWPGSRRRGHRLSFTGAGEGPSDLAERAEEYLGGFGDSSQ